MYAGAAFAAPYAPTPGMKADDSVFSFGGSPPDVGGGFISEGGFEVGLNTVEDGFRLYGGGLLTGGGC